VYHLYLAEIKKWRDRAAELRADARAKNNPALVRAAEDYELMADHEERMLASYRAEAA